MLLKTILHDMNWYKYWNENEIVNNANPYRQVGKTSYGRHPSVDEWNRLIAEIHKLIDLRESDTILDLCCGNGMMSNSIAKSCQSIVAVDFSKKLLGNFIPVSKKIHKINCDIRDIDCVNKALKGCDLVFHLAALVGIPFSYHAPETYIDTNIKGAFNVIQSCLDYSVLRVFHPTKPIFKNNWDD